MKNSARRIVGGNPFTPSEPNGPKVADRAASSQGFGGGSGAVETMREEDGDTDVAGPVEVIREVDDDDLAREFVSLRLDAASAEAIERLEQDDEVIVLMPSQEFVIVHGPKRTMLHTLCRNVGMTVRINKLFEGETQPAIILHLRPAAMRTNSHRSNCQMLSM